MRALVITEHGPPEVLKVLEQPDPRPGAGEVRIAVKAAGINFADLLARLGFYADAPKPPCATSRARSAPWSRCRASTRSR